MELTYEKTFVEKKLLAYIGNKRKLVPLIIKAIFEIQKRGSQPVNHKGWFVDLFSGTGVVARLAKSLGFRVIANDWEYYSYIFNKGFLENSKKDLKFFSSEGGLENVLKKLNSLKKLQKNNSYIAKYYCPRNDREANPEKERLFYTRKNGILIDNIRAAIDELYPVKASKINSEKKITNPQELKKIKKRNLLLALLLYEASKRSNTSGVFKAFHHGFGGKNQDALSRILSSVELSVPELSQYSHLTRVYNLDATCLAKKIKNQKVEIVYLDPPYNQHQYGSNYHLLNTISLNDQPVVNKNFMVGGKKKNKSAIRQDWNKTKSQLCYKKEAVGYFKNLLQEINSKYLLVSYSTEGIIPFDQLLNLLAEKGKLAIVTSSYIRYRGGRQANHTQKKNVEFIIIVDTALKNQAQDIDNIKGVLNNNQLNVLFEDFFPIDKINRNSNFSDEFELLSNNTVQLKKHNFSFVLDKKLKLPANFLVSLKHFSYQEQSQIIRKIKSIYNFQNDEKAKSILNLLQDNYLTNKNDRNYFLNELFRLFKKTKKNVLINHSLKKKMIVLFKKSLKSFNLPKTLSFQFEKLVS